MSWIDDLSEEEAGAIIKYKQSGIDSLSEQEAGLVIPHVGKLKGKQEEKSSFNIGTLNDFGKTTAGLGVGVADLLSQIPKFAAGALGSTAAMLTGDKPSEAENFYKATQDLWRDPSQILKESGLSTSEYTTDNLGHKAIMAPLEAVGQGVQAVSELAPHPEQQALIRNLANATMAVGGIPGTKALGTLGKKALGITEVPSNFTGYKGRPAETPQEVAARMQAEMDATKSNPAPTEQMELDLGQPNKFGQRPSEYSVDENGIPIKQEASLEAQITERGGQDLFSPENVQKETISRNIGQWEEPYAPGSREYLKQQEIEQAYVEKAKQEEVSSETFPEIQPEQSSPIIEKISPLGGVGKKQGGAVGFKPEKPPTFEQFSKTLDENISEEVARKVYEQYYGDVKTSTPEAAAISKIAGLPKVESLKPVEEMVPRWQTESDVSGNPVTRALRENWSSGGRMTAARTGNSFIDWNVEHILSNVRDAQVKIKEATHSIKGEAKKLSGGLIGRFGEGEKNFVDAMAELLRVEGKKENPNISPQAQQFANTLRGHLDTLGKEIQQEVDAQGIKGFKWRSNYLSAMFTGPYRSVVSITEPLKNGGTRERIVAVIAGKTKQDAAAAVVKMREKFPNASIPDPVYKVDYDNASTELGKRYGVANEILNVMRSDSEIAAKFQDALEEYYAKSNSDYFGYKQHTKQKAGIYGSEGKTPWRNARDNSYDLLEAQLNVIDHGYNWLAQQRTAKTLNKLLADESINMPEAKQYVSMYMDHAYGQLKNVVPLANNLVSFAAETMGLAPSQLKEMSGILRNFALVHTLGVNGGFFASQFIQVPQALALSFSRALETGITANPVMAKTVGTLDAIALATGKLDKMTEEGKYFAKYGKENGVIDPHLVEHSIHRKVIPTTGMGPIKKAMSGTANVIFKGMDIESQVLGRLFIEAPEVWTRSAFYMSMGHYYKQAGYSLKEAAHLADKDTSIFFVDYSPQERAMAFQKLGEVGKYASTVSTFKLNALNQLPTYANRGQYKTLAVAGLVYLAVSGLTGLPGMDEAEDIATLLKKSGIIDNTPKEYLLKNSPDMLNYGPLSHAPEIVGLPAMSMHTKFSQSDVLPNGMLEFLYPLASFYGNAVKKTTEAIGTPTPKREAAAVRQAVPGNLKYLVDKYSSLNQGGIIQNPNDLEGAGFARTDVEQKMSQLFGVPSQREYKEKIKTRMDTLDQKIWQDKIKSLIKDGVDYIDAGDTKRFDTILNKLMQLDPENGISALNAKLETKAIANNMSVEQYMIYKFAKQPSFRNMQRMQNYQEMK